MIKFVVVILLIILLILNSWRTILFNLDTHLPGWYDELFIIWIFQNNIGHFSTFDFKNLYETNAIYPFKHTLSFAEHMFFPSLLVWIISIFTKSPIAQYNILIILNHILVFLSGLLLFKKLVKNNHAAILSAFYISYSPYFFIKVSHFQMIFFWPALLSFYFLADYFEKVRKRSLILTGIFAGLQFLSSIYLGVFTLVVMFFWFFSKFVYERKLIKKLLLNFLLVLACFLTVSLVSIIGYLQVNSEYKIKRDYREYVTYSAHLTDYLFPPRNQASLLYTSFAFDKLKGFNKHVSGEFAASAGLIPFLLGLYLLFPKIKKDKDQLKFEFSFSIRIFFALTLIITGFIFSLGPRLFVNGIYAGIPLPYDLILKILGPVGIIRALARWQFLIMVGASILLALGLIKFQDRFAKGKEHLKTILFIAVFTLLALEFYQLRPFEASARDWSDKSYLFVNNNICREPGKVLLEYPFHYRNLDGSIVKDVNYMAQILLNSTQHNCLILSGYYGFEPSEYIKIRDEFGNGFDSKDIKIINNLKIDYVKFNNFAITNDEKGFIEGNKLLAGFNKVYEDKNTTIFKVDSNETD